MLRMPDYWCDTCDGRFEIGVVEVPAGARESEVVPKTARCPRCGRRGYHVIGAPKLKTVWGCAETRGKPDPKPHPNAMDTSALGEGMSMQEWRAERRKLRRAERHKRMQQARDAVWSL